jgi:hypothetical protein
LLVLVLGTGAGATMLTSPATAGGWAATVIDPVATIEPGKAHEVSFWVLQHGTHPFNWAEPASIGTVGLMLSDDRGSQVTFTGKELPEPAHYVTTVTVPYAGEWKVVGVQGIFAGFRVGTVTVPGTFKPLGVPAAPSATDMAKYWPGKVRPPVLKEDQNRDAFVYDHVKPDVIVEPAPANAAAGGNDTAIKDAAGGGRDNVASDIAADRPGTHLWILTGGLVVLLLVALALGRRWWIRHRVPQI